MAVKTRSDYERMSKTELVASAKTLLDLAESEGRPLTPGEQRVYGELEAAIDWYNSNNGPGPLRLRKESSSRGRSPSNFAYYDQASAEWVRDVGRGQSLSESAKSSRDADGPSLGGMIVGAATGNWHGLEREYAAVRESDDSQGGFVVSSTTSRNFIDLARSFMVMDAAGMRTIPFPAEGNEFNIARVISDPTSYWRHESVAVTASGPTFEKITLRPRMLACLVPVSIEFLEDVANGQQMIEGIIAKSMAVALDAAILRGVPAAGSIGGISQTQDVQTTAINGTWSYDHLLDAMKLIMDSNGPSLPSAVILSTASENRRRKMKDGDGLYLSQMSTPLADVQFLATTSIPDTLGAGTATELYTGDFSKVLLAVKTQLKVEVLAAGTGTDAAAGSINATTQFYRWIRCYMRVDSHIEQPTHLWYGSGVTN